MYKLIAITIAALVALVAVAQASGYGSGSGSGYGGHMQQSSYGPQQSYGQNYERKTGFKTVIYHPYGGTSNRFDYRTFPAYAGSGYNSYNSHPAPTIRTGLEYTIGDNGYGNGHGQSYGGNSY